jgi:hypothetical protein
MRKYKNIHTGVSSHLNSVFKTQIEVLFYYKLSKEILLPFGFQVYARVCYALKENI